MKQRNIALSIVLTVVTCGIYWLYWLSCLTNDIHRLSGKKTTASGRMAALYSVITCTFYSYYWYYKAGDELVEARRERGLPLDVIKNKTYAIIAVVMAVVILVIDALRVAADVGLNFEDKMSRDPGFCGILVVTVLVMMIGALIFQCIITGILFWIIYRRSDENPRVLYLLMAILRVNIFAIAFLQASVNDVIAQDEMRQVEE